MRETARFLQFSIFVADYCADGIMPSGSNKSLACEQAHLWVTLASDLPAKPELAGRSLVRLRRARV